MEEKKKEYTVEEMIGMIEEKIQLLQNEDTSLESSFQIYKEGMELLKKCSDKIETVEKQVQVLSEGGEYHDF